MKLFLQRISTASNNSFDAFAQFIISDESGHQKYTVTSKNRPSCQILYIEGPDGGRIAEITHYMLIVNHFSVRYDKRQLSIVPQLNHSFTLMLYGSSMTFSGTSDLGCFRLSDVDHSTVMIMEKKSLQGNEYFELDIRNPFHEKLCLCTAICTALFISAKSKEQWIPCGT